MILKTFFYYVTLLILIFLGSTYFYFTLEFTIVKQYLLWGFFFMYHQEYLLRHFIIIKILFFCHFIPLVLLFLKYFITKKIILFIYLVYLTMSINVRILGVLIVLMFILSFFWPSTVKKYLKKFYRYYEMFFTCRIIFLFIVAFFMVKSIRKFSLYF